MKESQIQTKILKHLLAHGVYCWRNNTMGVYDPKIGGYRYNPISKAGVGDIIAILPGGQHCEIEVKSATGKQSPNQFLHQQRVEKLGGKYILARNIKDVSEICG